MGPNLDFLAVTNQGANSVTFIDIRPKSATLHKIVKTTLVGAAPRGIAWQPGNEDILVVNEGANSMSMKVTELASWVMSRRRSTTRW